MSDSKSNSTEPAHLFNMAEQLVDEMPLLNYAEGLASIAANSKFVLKLSNEVGPTCANLALFKRAAPPPVKGVTVPEGFSLLEPAISQADKRDFLLTMQALHMGLLSKKPFDDLLVPYFDLSQPLHTSMLCRLTTRLLVEQEQVRGRVIEQAICVRPDKLPKGSQPRAFVPERSWFAPGITKLEPHHILTLMPEAEQKQFMLFLGRTLCGRDGSLPLDTELGKLNHKYRKLTILFGRDPGTGKSTMCEHISSAMLKLGYKVEPFRSLGDRFNMGRIYTSDLAFKDDNVKDSVAKLLNSEELKSIVTGSELTCENKGTNAYTVLPTCTVMFITNDFDQSHLFGKDTGVLDRLNVLYTYTTAELENILHTTEDELLAQSPCLRTQEHIDWLSAKLDCDPEAIYMWLFRLSVDYFLQCLLDKQLEREVAMLTSRLRFPITYSALQNVVAAMLLAELCRTGKMPGLYNKAGISSAANSYAFLRGDPRAHVARTTVHKHWVEAGRPASHPWHGLKSISVVSLIGMLLALEQAENNPAIMLDDLVKLVFGKLHTWDNISIGSGKTYVTKAWEVCRSAAGSKQLRSIAESIDESMSEYKLRQAKQALCDSSQPAKLDYVQKYGYCPEEHTDKLQQAYINANPEDQVNFLAC